MPIHVAIEVDRAVAAAPIKRALKAMLADHGRTDASLAVVVVTDDAIAALHAQYLGIDEPTDCLSFPLAESADDPELGEVYASADTAARVAAERGHSLDAELLLYAVHGALHLLGYDDHDEADLARMRAAERRYAGIDGGAA